MSLGASQLVGRYRLGFDATQLTQCELQYVTDVFRIRTCVDRQLPAILETRKARVNRIRESMLFADDLKESRAEIAAENRVEHVSSKSIGRVGRRRLRPENEVCLLDLFPESAP